MRTYEGVRDFRPLLITTAILCVANRAAADGERTPMIGGSVMASHDEDAERLGVQLEATYWFGALGLGRLGIALEGSERWGFISDQSVPRTTTLGASARVLVFDTLVPSLIQDRDVELGIELHAFVERAWWHAERRDPTSYGLGLAIRLRGGGDDNDNSSNLLAESRVFIRAMWSHHPDAVYVPPEPEPGEPPILTRTESAVAGEKEIIVMVGLGAAWGTGTRAYLRRFHQRPIETIYFGGQQVDR